MSDLDTTTDEVEIVAPETQEKPIVEENQDSTPEQDALKDEEAKKERHNRTQQRINQLTREKMEAERKYEELQRQYNPPEKLYQPFQQPTLEQFDYDTERYGQAMMQYAQAEAQRKYQVSVEEDKAQRQHFEQQRYLTNIIDEHGKREKAFIREAPDYTESVMPFMETVGFRDDILETIGLSDKSPAILYYLSKNPEEAYRISDMPPHHAARQIALIESKLVSKSKTVTNAPPPAPSLKGGANTQRSIESMTTEERINYWNAQLKRK